MKVGIFGAGAYALALSNILNDNHSEITIWTEFEEEKEILVRTRSNPIKLPNFLLGNQVIVTTSIEEAINEKDLLILAVPAQFLNSVCLKMEPFIDNHCILIASKGIDTKNLLFMEEIVSRCFKTDHIAVLSGPTFAKDILIRKKMGLSVAYKTDEVKDTVSRFFMNDYIDLDFTTDIMGVELCGSLKNIYAILMGILEGLSCNESTKAMFMTKIAKEIEKILESFSCNKETILSYAGIGDLLLTCTSISSRNYSFGVLLGQGVEKTQISEYLAQNTVEGVYTLESITSMVSKSNSCYILIDTLRKIISYECAASILLTLSF